MKKYMKFYASAAACVALSLGLSSCDDFFEPETDDSLNGDKYMSSLTEMYTGYLGILTKMQAIGDKSIYLTDTRGELLEPTDQSIADLISIYNYDDDLSGNKYADPSGYYDVVIACNDYLSNIFEFKEEHPELIEDSTLYNGLISSAIRVKVWAYISIGEIYGQALWFDDPILKNQDLTDLTKFQLVGLKDVVNNCINLLENGYEGYPANLEFSWKDWLDPETALASSEYRYWDMMTPPYEALLSKLYLWKGAYLNAEGADATYYYKTVADVILKKLNSYFSVSSSKYYYARTAATPGNYPAYWDNVDPYARVVVSAITYDYTKNQTNKLLKHFSNEYPNEYLLRPSEVGRGRWADDTFNPGASTSIEKRGNNCCKQNNGAWYIAKFRPVGSSKRTFAYQDDVHIYTFRSEDYHLMLIEALNNLGRFKAASAVLNTGCINLTTEMDSITNHRDSCSAALIAEWDGFNINWTGNPEWGTNNYPNVGFRGCMTLKDRKITESKEANDSCLANEYCLEFPAEGKVYPTLVRMAVRWNNPDFVIDRVTPKYGADSSKIASKIESTNSITGLPGYFVPWDLHISK